MRRPRLTQKVIRGILAMSDRSALLWTAAGDTAPEDRDDRRAIVRANEWAKHMRWWYQQREASANASATGGGADA